MRRKLTQSKPAKRAFVQKTFALGANQNFSCDKAFSAADALEDEELSRKLPPRKRLLRSLDG